MREDSLPDCPDNDALVRASAGCLLPEEARRVLAHVETCEACQEEIREIEWIEAAVRELASRDARESSGREERAASFAQRLHAHKQAEIHSDARRPSVARWLPIAAMFPVLVVSFIVSRTHTAVVRADALLERVVTESHTRPAGMVQRVRIQLKLASTDVAADWPEPSAATPAIMPLRMEPVSVVREVVDGFAIIPGTEPPAASIAPPAALARVLDLQPVDWQRPLGIERLRTWRRTLTDKHDQLTYVGRDLVVLKTTTMQGVLREVTLVVRLDSYRVIRQSLVFEGLGRVEIEELEQWRVEPAKPAALTASNAVNGADAGATVVDADEIDRAELDARLVLRDTDLDLRDDVRVSRVRELVRVDGAVASAALRRDVSARLSALAHVRPALRVQDDTQTAAPAVEAVSVSAAASSYAAMEASSGAGLAPSTHAARPELSRWVTRMFADGTKPRTMFVPELTRLVSTMSRRMRALQELGQRYPEAEVQRLSVDARAQLRDLLNRHYAALTADLEALDSRVAVLVGSSTNRCNLVAHAPADWTRRAATGLTQARALERALQELLVHEDLPVDPDGHQGVGDFASTFSALWDAVNLPLAASS